MIARIAKGRSFRAGWVLTGTAGEAVDADALPVVTTIFKNLAATAETATVTDQTASETGSYALTFTPASPSYGDIYELTVESTIAGSVKSTKMIVVIDERRPAAEFAGYDDIIFVRKSGNDSNLGTEAAPLLTLTAAKTAATAGELIVVGPGTYDEDDLAKDGVDWYFERGAKVIRTASGTAPYLFDDGGVAMTYNVLGFGHFEHVTENYMRSNHVDSRTYHESIYINVLHRIFYIGNGRVKAKAWYLECTDAIIDTVSPTAVCVLEADELITTTSGGWAVENDEGISIVKARRIYASSSAVEMASAGGFVIVDADEITSGNDGTINCTTDCTVTIKNALLKDLNNDGTILLAGAADVTLINCVRDDVIDIGHTGTFRETNHEANINAILADTADMQPKFGVIQDFGNGPTLDGYLNFIVDEIAVVEGNTTSIKGVGWVADTDNLKEIKDQLSEIQITADDGATASSLSALPADILAAATSSGDTVDEALSRLDAMPTTAELAATQAAIIAQGDIAWVTATSVTVASMSTPALAQFVTDDTGETAAVAGSVAGLGQAEVVNAVGSGDTPYEIESVDDEGNPIGNARVYVTTDLAGTNIVAGSLFTNDFGNVTFMLNSGGTYYVWQDSPSFNFSNPTEITVD